MLSSLMATYKIHDVWMAVRGVDVDFSVDLHTGNNTAGNRYIGLARTEYTHRI
jgi:hypothetical protein